MRYKTYLLEDLCKNDSPITYGVVKPGESGNVKLIRSTDVGLKKIRPEELRTISDDVSKKFSRTLIRGDELIISLVGNPGKLSLVDNNLIGSNIARQVARIRLNNKIVYREFLYYYLSVGEGRREIESKVVGSVQKVINLKDLKKVRVHIPSIVDQKAIANILSSLDDKIELNNKINNNLEEMAQAIYKHWFVDFEFPNEDGEPYKSSGGEMVDSEFGLIPKGWAISSIGDYCEVKSGYAFKGSWWSDDGVGVIKIKDLDDLTINLNSLSHVQVENTIKAQNFKVDRGDILIAMTGATIGKIGIVPKSNLELYVNQRVGKFFIGDKPLEKLPFLFCQLRETRVIESIKRTGEGSAQPNISGKQIMSIKYPKNKDVIRMFNNYIEPFFDMIIKNLEENMVLSETRDTLLPKLMSGELRVPIKE